MDHSGMDFKHTLLCHAKNVLFKQIGHIFFAKVERHMGDVPLFSLSRLYFEDKPLVSIRALDLLNLEIRDERILLLECIDQRFEIWSVEAAAYLEFSLPLCLIDDLVVRSKKDVTLGLSFLLGFQQISASCNRVLGSEHH